MDLVDKYIKHSEKSDYELMVWYDKERQAHLIRDMDLGHLINIRNFLYNLDKQDTKVYQRVQDEINRRRTKKVMKKTFKIPVTWEVYARAEVEAENLEEAYKIIEEDKEDIPLPTETCYVDGTFKNSFDNIEELKAFMELDEY
jgi:hypothetical protein